MTRVEIGLTAISGTTSASIEILELLSMPGM